MTELTQDEHRQETLRLSALARSSVALILELQDESGAYPASPTFSAYKGYSWFRDGSFIADAMSSAGQVDSANRFFDWCGRILDDRADQVATIVARAAASDPVSDGEMLATRFTFAGAEGVDDWWDFQLDGYGTWLWAVAEHARRHSVDLERWRSAIDLSVAYLLSSWQRPCFDWWEENAQHVHVSTLGCIAAGLDAIGEAVPAHRVATSTATAEIRRTILETGLTDGHLAKWVGSSEVDASLAAVIYPLQVFSATEPVGAGTIAAVDGYLNVGGGVHRYLADTFYGGGQWPLLSCTLGLAFVAAGRHDRALEQLRWAASVAGPLDTIPEQVQQHVLAPPRIDEWINRWGPVADPLLWSHAMFVRLAVELDLVEDGAA